MLIAFGLSWIFGSFSAILYILILDWIALSFYSYISKVKLNQRFVIILMLLVPVNILSLGITAFITNRIEILLWKITGDYKVMDAIIRNFWLVYVFTSIPGSLLLGYVSSFAFENLKDRKSLMIYWIVLNSLSCILIYALKPLFHGLPPYK